MEELKQLIRNVPDFPKKGIGFKDITTLIKRADAFQKVIDLISDRFKDRKIDVIVAIESRGFILGGALAYKWGVGFVPVRKPGKLPAETIREEYELEYGTDALEIHRDAIREGQNVLIVDDLLATGGTLAATARLVERLGGKVAGIACMIELNFLKGREKLSGYDFYSIIQYEEE